MRIRFLVSIASHTWSYGAGQEAEFPDDEARAHIAGGNAVAVESTPGDARGDTRIVESTESPAPAVAERAVRPTVRRGRA